MSAIDDLTPAPDQPEISEGNQSFHQKAYTLYKWMRERLGPAMVELRDLIVNSITGAFSGTSDDTVTIVDTGEVSIGIEPGLAFRPGTPARLAYVTDPLNYIDGITKTYNSTTGAYVMYAQESNGSGEYSNWSLTIIPSGGGLAGLGSNTFVGAQYVPDDPYDATSWNGSTAVPTKNAIRDALVALIATIKNLTNDSTLASNSGSDIASTEWVRSIALIKNGSSVTLNGASAFDFSIPPDVKEVVVDIKGASTNGSSNYLLQIGDAGGVENTGYSGNAYNPPGAANGNSSAGFLTYIGSGSAAIVDGKAILTLQDPATHTWVCSSCFGRTDTSGITNQIGSKTLSPGPLSVIRITTLNGTDSYDSPSGKANISWRF